MITGDDPTTAPNAAAVLCDVRWMVSRRDLPLNRELLTVLDVHGQYVAGLAADDAMGIDAVVVKVVRTEDGLRDLVNWVDRARQRRKSSLKCLEGWFPDRVATYITALHGGDRNPSTINLALMLVMNGIEAQRVQLPEVVDPSPELSFGLACLPALAKLVDEALDETL